jgi:hypothetical protein
MAPAQLRRLAPVAELFLPVLAEGLQESVPSGRLSSVHDDEGLVDQAAKQVEHVRNVNRMVRGAHRLSRA